MRYGRTSTQLKQLQIGDEAVAKDSVMAKKIPLSCAIWNNLSKQSSNTQSRKVFPIIARTLLVDECTALGIPHSRRLPVKSFRRALIEPGMLNNQVACLNTNAMEGLAMLAYCG